SPLAGKVAEGRMGSPRGAHCEDLVGSPPALRATSPLRGELAHRCSSASQLASGAWGFGGDRFESGAAWPGKFRIESRGWGWWPQIVVAGVESGVILSEPSRGQSGGVEGGGERLFGR